MTSLARIQTQATTHQIGKIGLTVTNYGTIGAGYLSRSRWTIDCFTGQRAVSCEYPRNSRADYVFGGTIWIGGVVNGDTLVSTGSDGWGYGVKHSIDNNGWRHRGMEFTPDYEPFGQIKRRSIMNPNSNGFEGAISEEDIVAVYTDTVINGHRGLTFDNFDGRPHKPLHVEVTQSTYAWSYPYAEDFILMRYQIENIGVKRIENGYFGFLLDGDVYGEGYQFRGADDDLCGFFKTVTTSYAGCEFEDTINLAWMADNDGDFIRPVPTPGVVGTRILMAPGARQNDPTFNWWVSNSAGILDFGPRHKDSEEFPFRDWRTGGLGTPEGDRNKYAMLRNGEMDYDQAYTFDIDPDDPDWLYPNYILARYIARGRDSRTLLSVGPFNISPGHVSTIIMAFVAGENFHLDHMNFRRHLQPGYYFPDDYYAHLGIEELGRNAIWASWVFDNPGVDTDGDGYYGKYRMCCADSVIVRIDTVGLSIDTIWADICDTVWYEGDGQPDFRGATAPPAPEVWVNSTVGEIHLRWNGYRSETTADMFSREIDFDGYRVYLARDNRHASFTLLASYDRENYLKYYYNVASGEFEVNDDPFTREELICLYGDSCNDPNFDPRDYDLTAPFYTGDSLIYFATQDFNRSEPGINTPITKVYPDAPYPPYGDTSLIPDSLRDVYLTEDGYFKYFEYEFTVTDLLPTVPYYVNVTAFDVGSPNSGLTALESPREFKAQQVYPMSSPDAVAREDLKVYVYPNPYRIDGGYLDAGYEGRDARWYIPERLRLIHFVNVPSKCWIRVYSLDGDLIRELRHDKDPEDPTASHATWDMITRNTQALVSGIYYWTVEADAGDVQIGKLVVIK